MILYLWIEKHKNIKETGFNFSSEYKFDFILDSKFSNENFISGKLKCEKIKTPKLFHESIKSFKAIIGENGSGKTSIINYLINLLLLKGGYVNCFLVTDRYIFHSSKFVFEKSISKIKLFNLIPVITDNLTITNSIAEKELGFQSVIHFSSIINMDRVFDYFGSIGGSSDRYETNYWHYYDCTTENAIVNAQNDNLGSQINREPNPQESELLAFRRIDTIKIMEFLLSDFVYLLPFKINLDDVVISINKVNENFWKKNDNYYKSYNEGLGSIETKIDQIIQESSNIHNKFELDTYISFIYALLTFEYSDRTRFRYDQSNENPILDTIILFNNIEIKEVKSFIQELIGKCKSIKNKSYPNIELIIDSFNSLKFKVKNDDGIIISIENKETIQNLIDLMKDHFVRSLFSIEFIGLSSGEKDMISMYSRVFNLDIPEEQKEILVLLDEIDVTFHPFWQKEMVFHLNEFFPKVFPDKIIQIIITSHSPIMISDLPKENIIFLKKYSLDDEEVKNGIQEEGNCKIVKDIELQDLEKTFAQNIHTLLSNSFFLNDGLIGDFAKEKISELLKFLDKKTRKKSKIMSPDDCWKIINIIGEPMISNKLMQMYEEEFPKKKNKIIEYHQKEIERLKK